MANDLSLKAKRLLATQHNKLMHNDTTVAKASNILIEILTWCDELEFTPGRWLNPKKTYQFDRPYIAQINQILLDEKYASIFDDFSLDTHRSAAQRNPNEKQGQLKPTHHLILAAATESLFLGVMGQRFYPSKQINIELDVGQLNLTLFDSLVIVENRDSFNDWFAYEPYTRLPNALVVYRGDKHHSTACKKLLKTWLNTQSNKPAIYFGDYDLAGLRIAISGDYSHLLFPQYNCLKEHVIKQHYPDNQQKYLVKIEKECPHGWQHLLTLMSDSRAGLRQQMMYDTRLQIYPR